MNRGPLRLVLLLIPLALAAFALSTTAQAVIPPPDGGYPGYNTAEGTNALFHINPYQGALYNTAVGNRALFSTTSGGNNTAVGALALYDNNSAYNTAVGSFSMTNTVLGEFNSALGSQAMAYNVNGSYNTAVGYNALYFNVDGNSNIALGISAGLALTSGSENIYIGNLGGVSESQTIRMGDNQTNTYIAGISGVTVPAGVPVIVGADGHLGTVTSSARFKEAIKPMDKASEAILALKPVSFRYKHELDPKGTPQFGLVAEEVEKADPDLVARDAHGKAYTVRYEAVNAMLLNEFLKEHRKVQDLEANAAHQQKQIEALTAGLQKVCAELELSKSAPQTVLNDQ